MCSTSESTLRSQSKGDSLYSGHQAPQVAAAIVTESTVRGSST